MTKILKAKKIYVDKAKDYVLRAKKIKEKKIVKKSEKDRKGGEEIYKEKKKLSEQLSNCIDNKNRMNKGKI